MSSPVENPLNNAIRGIHSFSLRQARRVSRPSRVRRQSRVRVCGRVRSPFVQSTCSRPTALGAMGGALTIEAILS